MKNLAIVFAVGATALLSSSAANASDGTVKMKAATYATQQSKAATDATQQSQSTDISSRGRHCNE